ncbi:hypothetical protein DNTS_021892 [Danionella cerebrum]|uniref:Uncharacterized protein n=1 Tax=Danionella cerebrum TaxID=2873325 RepID=A0A553QL02_9TELE|nr:hypothetical protein DNTS_021892 [Danionella translucida]
MQKYIKASHWKSCACKKKKTVMNHMMLQRKYFTLFPPHFIRLAKSGNNFPGPFKPQCSNCMLISMGEREQRESTHEALGDQDAWLRQRPKEHKTAQMSTIIRSSCEQAERKREGKEKKLLADDDANIRYATCQTLIKINECFMSPHTESRVTIYEDNNYNFTGVALTLKRINAVYLLTHLTQYVLYLNWSIHLVQSLFRKLFQGTQSSLRDKKKQMARAEREPGNGGKSLRIGRCADKQQMCHNHDTFLTAEKQPKALYTSTFVCGMSYRVVKSLESELLSVMDQVHSVTQHTHWSINCNQEGNYQSVCAITARVNKQHLLLHGQTKTMNQAQETVCHSLRIWVLFPHLCLTICQAKTSHCGLKNGRGRQTEVMAGDQLVGDDLMVWTLFVLTISHWGDKKPSLNWLGELLIKGHPRSKSSTPGPLLAFDRHSSFVFSASSSPRDLLLETQAI